jgi:branched-chain amino acid transport system substrate-binding protein
MLNMLRHARIALAAMLLSTAGLACGQEPITLGVVLPLSGNYGEFVKRYILAPTEFAVKEVNARGGVMGRQVRLVIEDTRFDAASAVSALRKLADVDKVSVVFTDFTPLALPQLPIAEEKKIIVIAPHTEHPDLTKSKWGVRATPTADRPGVKIAELANKLGVKTAAILVESNEASRLSERAFESEFKKSGGKVVATETFKPSDTEMRGQLTKLRASRADALYIITAAGRPMALAMRQVAETGYKPKYLFANHNIEDREVKALGGNVAEGVIYTTFDIDQAFSKRFEAALGYPADANAAKQYDATILLFESMKRAKSADDATKVRDALVNFGDFNGTIGKYRFAGSGGPDIDPIIKVVRNGEFVHYKP